MIIFFTNQAKVVFGIQVQLKHTCSADRDGFLCPTLPFWFLVSPEIQYPLAHDPTTPFQLFPLVVFIWFKYKHIAISLLRFSLVQT